MLYATIIILESKHIFVQIVVGPIQFTTASNFPVLKGQERLNIWRELGVNYMIEGCFSIDGCPEV